MNNIAKVTALVFMFCGSASAVAAESYDPAVVANFQQSPGFSLGDSIMLAELIQAGAMDESTFRSVYHYDSVGLDTAISIAKDVKRRTISLEFFHIIMNASVNGEISYEAARRCGMDILKQNAYEIEFRKELSEDAVKRPSAYQDDVRKAHMKAILKVIGH
ncbi:MAG: hypothetical protein WCW52_00875 [Elusimicrobiales bacterium]